MLVEISTACSLDLKYPVVNLCFTMPNTSHTQGNKMTVWWLFLLTMIIIFLTMKSLQI